MTIKTTLIPIAHFIRSLQRTSQHSGRIIVIITIVTMVVYKQNSLPVLN